MNHSSKGNGLLKKSEMITEPSPDLHDLFWTETWANYLSKEYFGNYWLGAKYGYVVQPLNSFNKSMIELAKMPIIWSPITPFSH